jgi:acyl carrier protein
VHSEIEAKLMDYIKRQILKRPNYALDREDTLISSGLIDSFHLVDLAVFIEEQFGVRIEDTELNQETFDSVSELAEMIHQRQL